MQLILKHHLLVLQMVKNIHKPINKYVRLQPVEIVLRSKSLCHFQLFSLFIWCFVFAFFFSWGLKNSGVFKKMNYSGQSAKQLFEMCCHSISWPKKFAYFVPQDYQLVDLFGQPPCPTPSFSSLGQDSGEVPLLKRNETSEEISHIRLGRWIDRKTSVIFVETLTVQGEGMCPYITTITPRCSQTVA